MPVARIGNKAAQVFYMRMSLYLYWQDDQDLIALKTACGKDFLRTVRECLFAYLNGEEYRLPAPIGVSTAYANEVVTLSFPDTQCEDIVNFLSSLSSGPRNNAVKFVLRYYLKKFRDTYYIATPVARTIRLKLSITHDADLLGLYYYDPEHFAEKLLESVRAYVRKKIYVLQIPDNLVAISGQKRKSRDVFITFDRQDDDIVDYLDKLQGGFVASALKNIMRNAFSRPILYAADEGEKEIKKPKPSKEQPAKTQETKEEQVKEISPSKPEPEGKPPGEKQEIPVTQIVSVAPVQPASKEPSSSIETPQPQGEMREQAESEESFDMDIFGAMER